MRYFTEPLIFTVLLMLISATVFVWSLQLRFKRRELLHHERLAALEKGIDLPALTDTADGPRAPWSPRIYLLRGLLWLFSGIAIGVFLLGMALSTRDMETTEGKMYRIQRMRTSLTLSDEQVKALMAEAPRERRGMPFGSALFGLIPAAIGAAYLAFYSSERKLSSTPGA